MLRAEFMDRIRSAAANKTALCIQGGGTKNWYGQTPRGEILDTARHTGIIDYDPTELVMTARSGTLLSELQSTLAEQGQMLAFEPPAFGAQATIGGVIAAGLSGPRRASAGSVRDFVLGAVLINGRAERLVFGGQVMKNVAGYDVSRLLCGSMGLLGLLTDISIKVLPVPRSEITLGFDMGQESALATMNSWAGKPLPVSATSWNNGQLMVRLSGSEAATHAAQLQLGGTAVNPAEAAQHWASLREQTHAFFTDQPVLWRLSLPATTPVLDLGGHQLIEWGGAQRWLTGPASAAIQLRQTVQEAGGHATLFKSPDKSATVFQALPAPLLKIHQRLKAEFDPAGIFNPGRLYPEL